MTNPNDPAFLTIENYPSGSKAISSGLTKREWYAGLAMMGLLANSHIAQKAEIRDKTVSDLARWSVEDADALIEALNKEPK